jgi:uncharacterized integral membrane protein (TIGR00698 family)
MGPTYEERMKQLQPLVLAPQVIPVDGSGVARLFIPLGAVLALLPFVSAGVALVAGAAVGLTLGNPFVSVTRRVSHKLLALSVVGLGAGMDLRVVARAGATGFGYTVVSIAACLVLGALLSRALKVGANLGLLISVGTAICGGSAIAAVAPVLRPKEHEVTVALATVFLLNGLALFAFPAIGHAVGLDQEHFGLWAALAIHDTSSVVGATMVYGPRALEVATTIKLARALWIVPLTIVLGFLVARRANHANEEGAVPAGKAARPWFIVGFLVAAALATFVPSLHAPGLLVSAFAKHAMSSTLFLIGAGLTRSALHAVGPRPLVHGVTLWVVIAGGSLAAIALRVIG